jgi:hypothetical protein
MLARTTLFCLAIGLLMPALANADILNRHSPRGKAIGAKLSPMPAGQVGRSNGKFYQSKIQGTARAGHAGTSYSVTFQAQPRVKRAGGMLAAGAAWTRGTEPGVKSFLVVDAENLPFKPAEASLVAVTWGGTLKYIQVREAMSGAQVASAIADTLSSGNRYIRVTASSNGVRAEQIGIRGPLLELSVKYIQPDLLSQTYGQTHSSPFDDRFRR